jgi:glycosyltransferase involved in cell wall biosynthesis
MIQGKDIIVIGIQPWDISIGSNCKNIAEEFSRHNRVLYVNAPLDRFTKYRERNTEKVGRRIKVIQGKEPGLQEVGPNLWTLYPGSLIESINGLKWPWLFDILNKRNSRLFARDIINAAHQLGFKDYILFNDSSMFLGAYLKDLLNPKMYVYYMRDFLIKNPYWKRHGTRIEPRLIALADVVVNNSTLYTEYGLNHNPHSYMVGQGCDTTLFNDDLQPIEVATDLKPVPRPIIGYVGFLSSRRLDIGLLEYMATKRPEWSIVLVGPEDDVFKASALHNIPNVYFLGSRDSSILPSYIKGFDVAMNPQLINDATIGNYPRKIDEYLAMGKPTIGSATKAMEYFGGYTYNAHSHEEYLTLIGQALAEDNPELQAKRKAFGRSHTWENNVKEIYKCIELVADEKGIQL